MYIKPNSLNLEIEHQRRIEGRDRIEDVYTVISIIPRVEPMIWQGYTFIISSKDPDVREISDLKPTCRLLFLK